MLKINKILSKKIKSPLSLRGAKRRSNLRGFSLIELMIAVTILALAIFGIFHAYSVGFLGIADARDRTVATNYAREAMEDVKNMDFEKIVTTTKSVITSNIKYRVDVNVSLENENPNLKKVFTVVSWKDRNGVGKTVETSMLVNYTEIYASAAAKIVLFADSYTILSDSTTNITAVIKDIKGNTVIDWDGDNISFSVSPSTGAGSLSNTTDTTNGIATRTFNHVGTVGTGEIDVYVIEASVTLPPPNGNVVSDSVTIKVTDGPVKITLTADPDIIKASTENDSTITVSLCDAANQILKKSELLTDVVITFTDFGEGTLSTPTIIIPAVIGDDTAASVDIFLDSTGTPGLASVLATADNLESDTADVRFLGPPVSISISADPNPMYVDDDFSTITVSLLDVNGFCTNPAEEDIEDIYVTFLLSTDANGSLYPGSLTFIRNDSEGISLTTQFSGQHSTEEVTIDTVNGVGLTDGSVTINFLSSLEPDRFELTASPQSVAVGGNSTITATVYDGSKIVTNYDGTITFDITLGSGVFAGINPTKTTNGIATIGLSSISAGTVTVTVVSSDGLDCIPENGIVVGFYDEPDHIKLTTSPQSVAAGGSSIITATVCDSNFIHVSNYIGTITFTIFFEGLSPYDISVDTTNGMATTVLSFDDAGTATVTASSWYEYEGGGINLTSEVIEVDFYVETDLTLVEDSVDYDSANLIVSFKVDVVGEVGVEIIVDEMKIIWSESGAQERLSKIVIDEVEEVYTGSAKSGTSIDIIEYVDLSIEEHTIELTFIQDMAGRQIDVMFYPPGEGWYLIRFNVPASS